MKKFNHPLKDLGYFAYRWVSPIMDPLVAVKSISHLPKYFRDVVVYSRMAGSEKIDIMDTYPILNERTTSTPFDSHYLYQDLWAFKHIFEFKTKIHYDIGSNIEFASFLTAFTKVVFADIRPLNVDLQNFSSIKASVLNLPFETGSIISLSCLHVAEHIGLGRYGDPLDPYGTRKACKELSRVLAKKGNLYFSLPVGKPRLIFNAHRIHSPRRILQYFKSLRLVELSGIDDNGKFTKNISIKTLQNANYACGLFKFTKE